MYICFFFSSRRRHTRLQGDWSSDVCSSDLGQTVLVEDYLRACPDREGDLRTLVKTGRLQVGPGDVLPDEQIPSGEGVVRELLLGAAGAGRVGGRPDVLYSPAAFGHPPAWPPL